jgi:3-hydroxyisobutyrate dehydrogenase-like beta-hydroxyacid dehydrogenase
VDIAFLGLGQMGSNMARRLVDGGHRVMVWNRDTSKAEPFSRLGAAIVANPREAISVGTAMTMLANDDAVAAVAFGENGLLSAGPGLLHISSSTISVDLTQRLEQAHLAAGQRFASAQVLGRPDVAAAGMLSVIAAGATGELDAAQPLFDSIGRNTIRIGERPAMAAAAKIALNAGIPAIIQILTEQFRIAATQGIPPVDMVGLLSETGYGDRIFRSYAPMIAEQRFEPAGFPIELGRKDVGLALTAVAGASLPIAELIAARMDSAIAAGGGHRDWSALGQDLF